MYAGFDYGTSNCAVGVVDNNTIRLLAIGNNQVLMPSSLYALERELICEYVGQQIPDDALQQNFLSLRAPAMAQARSVRTEYDIRPEEQSIFFGQDAFDQYLSMPGEGYFLKSPKSFLGASGLRSEYIQFFEDIVTAMMINIKQRAETDLGKTITHTVIGRPVNFQGMNAEQSNRQAIAILTLSAQRAGFKSVEFLFEPIAAGLDFEARLSDDKTVLIVDIGGGTTDCAMVRMGPSHRNNTERQQDFIGHSGERVGGNDLDIQLAGKHLMPLFGMHSSLKNGLLMPTATYWDAVRTNDVGAQANFNSQQTELRLQQLMLDTTEPELLRRFITLRDKKQNHHILRSAEQAKISLSDSSRSSLDLNSIVTGLSCTISRNQFAHAIERPLASITDLMTEAIRQAAVQPDLIYITGGSAKSPIIRQAIEQKLGTIPVVDGDHFGSVATGLTAWAQRLFS
ncbi:Molecular chaperone [marine gamma proteobacterium HTCC2143]|jgi:hypothetical chaperone protein|uniref:Molecular chaperone n=1 Tax=marine gamma proteobacterium HTCC2143 TaxID=247633 RepID=A0YD65_9GAMM|nr:Molecular chaperone [marine gamma proteobacterium HTCC2143]